MEGEKDVLTLKEFGVPATTIPGGSNGWNPLIKKQPDFCKKYFDGKTVIIIPDNDSPGQKYMETGAGFLAEGGAVVHTFSICEELGNGEDISDWVEKNSPRNKQRKAGLLGLPADWRIWRVKLWSCRNNI